MQFPYLRNWQRQCDEIDENAVRSMCKSQCVVVQASSSMLSVPLRPRKTDGRTDKGSCETECDHRHELETDDCIDYASKLLLRKDLKEEE